MSEHCDKIWKIALVGVGGRGGWVIETVATAPNVDLVALVDLDPRVVEHARTRLGLAPSVAFDDLEQALAVTDAEVVIICTPMSTHAALCRIAFAHGMHVLVEKGMTFSWNEARELVAGAESAGVRFCVAQNYRYRSPIVALQRILEDPTHPDNPGTVSLVDCIHHRYRPDPHTSTYPYAMVWDMGCHHLDFLISWLGPISRVFARSYKAPWTRYEHDANITAFLEFREGAFSNYILTHDAVLTRFDLMVQGNRGVLRFEDQSSRLSFYPPPARSLASGVPRISEIPNGGKDVERVLGDFLHYIATGVEPGISGRRNLETMAACAMIVKSASVGRTVEREEFGEVGPVRHVAAV